MMPLPMTARDRTSGRSLIGSALLACVGGCGFFSRGPAEHSRPPAAAAAATAPAAAVEEAAQPAGPTIIELPQESWAGAGIDIQPAEVAVLAQKETLTGRITLNEDHVAHIFPLVSGRVDTVMVGLGDRVKKGQEMAIIESREVGQAMLQLVQDRLQLSFAKQRNEWLQRVAGNTQSLISLIRADTPIDQVNAEMHSRPLGDYRQRLMSAYIANDTAKKNLDRLAPLRGQGIVAARQIFEAEAAWTTARATLLSLLEQSEQDVRQEAIRSEQHVEEIETRLAVDETTLKILGFEDAAIADIDPSQGSDLAHCPRAIAS
jgi:membrane fusion protein, heavy metal efflux system